MKLKTIQKTLTAGLFAVTAGFAMQASAAPFTFTQYGGFEGGNVGDADYSGLVDGPLAPAATVYSTMSWASGETPQSSLVLATVTTPTAVTYDWQTISTLTHNNVIIPSMVSWGPQDIWGRLIITDTDGVDVVVLDDDSSITIDFTETPNQSGHAEWCVGLNPNGSACDDFFTFTDVGLGDVFFTGSDGTEYIAEFRLANPVNAVIIGLTVYTAELESSSLDVQMRIRAVTEVPEPAALSLLGFGLLGLGLARRRKMKA